jgi:hypothetical protein
MSVLPFFALIEGNALGVIAHLLTFGTQVYVTRLEINNRRDEKNEEYKFFGTLPENFSFLILTLMKHVPSCYLNKLM